MMLAWGHNSAWGWKLLEGNHFFANPYHPAVIHWKNAFADGAGCLCRVFEGWARKGPLFHMTCFMYGEELDAIKGCSAGKIWEEKPSSPYCAEMHARGISLLILAACVIHLIPPHLRSAYLNTSSATGHCLEAEPRHWETKWILQGHSRICD